MDENFKKIANAIIILSLLLLSFFIIKPIMVSIIMALIFAYIFSPVYDRINAKVKNKNISATIILLILIVLIILPLVLLTPVLMRQSIQVFKAAHDMDFVTPIKSIFPGLFTSEEVAIEVGYAISSLTTRAINVIISSLTKFVLNIPIILLHATVLFFVLFYVIRDKERVVEYVKSLLPFSKEVEKKLFDQTKGITSSILYGHLILGILQGIILGLGILVLGIPNALFLTMLAILSGILPVIGPLMVWGPLAIYLFSSGGFFSAWGIIIFGLASSNIDNVLRPMIVSRRTNVNSGLILVSMIGGLFSFGLLGLILGPLILVYLFIMLELYRGRGTSGIVIGQPGK